MDSAIAAAAGAASDADALVAVDAALEAAGSRLDGRRPDVAVLFLGGAHTDAAEAAGALVRERSRARHLLGGTTSGVVADDREHEHGDAVAVWLATLPGADLTPLRYPPPREDAGAGDDGWVPPPSDASGLVLLADPFTFPADGFCSWLAQARPDTALSGGLLSGGSHQGANRLLLDDAVEDGGAVGIAVGGAVRMRTLVSQGCRPVGGSYVVTSGERNLVRELAGRPPVDLLRRLYADADEADRALLREGLHVGTVIDEYREDPGPGDYLVRSVLGVERDGNGLLVGDLVRVGQTLRFHVRDAASADADLRVLLDAFRADGTPDAALLFTCNGRGTRLFGSRDHDAGAVRAAFGDVGLGGCFCAGELGPVGGRSFLHGFTASLVAFEPA